MANANDKPTLKITLEDLEKVTLLSDAVSPAMGPRTGDRQYGNISEPGAEPVVADEGKSNIFLQGWFYLGLAGLLGSLMGWAIGEPFFHEGGARSTRDIIFVALTIPLVLTFLCLGLSVAESIVERSVSKALQKGGLSLPVGMAFSVVSMIAGGIVYKICLGICVAFGIESYRNPTWWISRGIAWMIFAAAAGVVYGLVDRSFKKGRYGVLGAMIGGGLGGTLFDPISFLTKSGGPSRAIGFGLIGLATGVAIGIVESALKDRWMYVASGPLAGKQFILYKPVTVLGSSQQNDIYLFKDPSILPQHATIELRGAQTFLNAAGPVFVSGQPVRNRALRNGDLIQVGRYAFHFREKQR